MHGILCSSLHIPQLTPQTRYDVLTIGANFSSYVLKIVTCSCLIYNPVSQFGLVFATMPELRYFKESSVLLSLAVPLTVEGISQHCVFGASYMQK